jgi:hypothetical protein
MTRVGDMKLEGVTQQRHKGGEEKLVVRVIVTAVYLTIINMVVIKFLSSS